MAARLVQSFTGYNEDGSEQYELIEQAPGVEIAKPGKAGADTTRTENLPPYKVSPTDLKVINGGVASLYRKQSLDQVGDATGAQAVKNRALELVVTPGSAYYGNAAAAVKAAADEIAPEGTTDNFFFKDTIKGDPRKPTLPVVTKPPTKSVSTSRTPRQPGATEPQLPAVAPAAAPAAAGGVYVGPSGTQYTRAEVEAAAKKRGMTFDQAVQKLGLQRGRNGRSV